MKITFGCIVFNILSTLPNNMFEYCIQQIYDIAHEIIIVEGATKATTHYFDGNTTLFTNNGRSTDGTIDYLYNLQKKYSKIKIIIGEGFWNGKTDMCNAYASISNGDYIWQLDSDEFYTKEDQFKILKILSEKKPDAVHFYANHFFGGFDSCIDERCNSWGNDIPWMRIFRNIPGKSKWISHEPPNYLCDGLFCNKGNVITRDDTLKNGIKMFHYSCVIENQIKFKDIFFGQNMKYEKLWNDFKKNKKILIFGSKVYKFEGEHPDIIKNKYINDNKYNNTL